MRRPSARVALFSADGLPAAARMLSLAGSASPFPVRLHFGEPYPRCSPVTICSNRRAGDRTCSCLFRSCDSTVIVPLSALSRIPKPFSRAYIRPAAYWSRAARVQICCPAGRGHSGESITHSDTRREAFELRSPGHASRRAGSVSTKVAAPWSVRQEEFCRESMRARKV